MASAGKLPSGRWQAKVRKAGVATSKAFILKKHAQHWAKQAEIDISLGRFKSVSKSAFMTLSGVLEHYKLAVLPLKKSPKSAYDCINAIEPRLEPIRITQLTSTHIADYRDDRIQNVSGDTVRKELLN